MRDACVESLYARREVHGAVECEDGIEGREAVAEVYDGGGGAGAACAVGEDEGWGGGGRGGGVGVALERGFGEVGGYGQHSR